MIAELFERNLLIGHWYRGDSDEHGGQLTEFARMEPDGTFEFTFIQYDAKGNTVEESIELGDWGLVGNIHFTLTKGELIDGEHYEADMTNEDNYHAYKVIKLNSKILEYQHILTNEVFIMRRVVDKIAHC